MLTYLYHPAEEINPEPSPRRPPRPSHPEGGICPTEGSYLPPSRPLQPAEDSGGEAGHKDALACSCAHACPAEPRLALGVWLDPDAQTGRIPVGQGVGRPKVIRTQTRSLLFCKGPSPSCFRQSDLTARDHCPQTSGLSPNPGSPVNTKTGGLFPKLVTGL